MASYDLSQLTDAELTTLKTNLLASLNRSTNAQSYTAGGGRMLNRMAPKDVMEWLSAVNREIAARADSTGDPFIIVDFNDPV